MPPRDTKIEGPRSEKAANTGSRAVGASESSPVERGTTSRDHLGVEHEKRFSRRQVGQGLSAAGVVEFAGCLGSVGGGTDADGETIVWNGEAYEYSTTMCNESDGRATRDFYVSDPRPAEAELIDPWVAHHCEEHGALDEPGYDIQLHVRDEPGDEEYHQYRAHVVDDRLEEEGIDAFEWGSETRHTSGSVSVEPDPVSEEWEHDPDGGTVEWDISC